LEHAPRNPDHAAVLADLDPELHGLPLGIPSGVLGGTAVGKQCPSGYPAPRVPSDEEHAPQGGPDEATNPEWPATAADADEVIK
jgi:hypothetical protein